MVFEEYNACILCAGCLLTTLQSISNQTANQAFRGGTEISSQ